MDVNAIRKADGARGRMVYPIHTGHALYEWSDTQPRFVREVLPAADVADPNDAEAGRWGQVAELAQAASGAALLLGEIAAHCLNGGWYNEIELQAVLQLDRLEQTTAMMRQRVEAARRTQRNT